MSSQLQGLIFDVSFPCAAGTLVSEAGEEILFEIPADPPSTEYATGYDYYFCIRLANPTAVPRSVTVSAIRPGDSEMPDWRPSRVPLLISADLQDWYTLESVQADRDHERYKFHVVLAPGESIFVTNSFPWSSADATRWIHAAAARSAGLATVHAYGKSGRGRDLWVMRINDAAISDEQKDRVLVTSGLHPAEPDWLATTAIIEALVGGEEWAARIRRNYVVDVIPQANPDGADLGLNACNANGVNLYWDFRPDDGDASAEAVELWRWAQALRPSLYLDFHAYVHQLHKDFRPYLRQRTDYPPAMRRVAQHIDRRLVALCDGRSVLNPSTSDRRTLAPRLTAAFGTVTYPKFHLHFNHGPDACRQLGVQVFRAVVETALPYRPLARRMQPWAASRDVPRAQRLFDERRAAIDRLVRRLGRAAGFSKRVRPVIGQASALTPTWESHAWSRRGRVDPIRAVQSPSRTRWNEPAHS